MHFQHHEEAESFLLELLAGNHDEAFDEGFSLPEAVTYYYFDALEQAQRISAKEVMALVSFWRSLYVNVVGFCEVFSECKLLQFVELFLLGQMDFASAKSYLRVLVELRQHKASFVLAGIPQHGNLGDQAILLGTEYLLKKCYPDRPLIELSEVLCEAIQKLHMPLPVAPEARIMMHGGGNFGTLYPVCEKTRRWLVSTYRNHRIVLLPQSIFYSEDAEGRAVLQKSQTIYREAANLTIFERDEVSYARGRKYFSTAKNQLVPDFALSLESRLPFEECPQRRGICFFLRKDQEKAVSDQLIERIVRYLESKGIPYIMEDTVLPRSIFSTEDRERLVMEKIRQASQARMVITDRYHGTIFSVITHTPVMAFRSYDTKILAGLRWFKDLEWVYDGTSMDESERERVIDRYCIGNWQEPDVHSNCGVLAEEAVRRLEL